MFRKWGFCRRVLPAGCVSATGTHWLTVGGLPGQVPERNGDQTPWRGLTARHRARQTVTDAEVPDRAIHNAVTTLNDGRYPNPQAGRRSLAPARRAVVPDGPDWGRCRKTFTGPVR